MGRVVVALLAALTAAGCATPLSPRQITAHLFTAATAARYPFTAIGAVTYVGPDGGGSGRIALAADRRRFRIEIYDGAGGSRLAAASDGTTVTTLDPATGERTTSPASAEGVLRLPTLSLALPIGLLATTVTGALPPHGPTTATFADGRLGCAAVADPAMTLCADRAGLRRIGYHDGAGAGTVVELTGRIATNEGGVYVKETRLTGADRLRRVTIRWLTVTPNPAWDDGFFTFDEPIF